MTEDEDHESVQKSMSAIADVLVKEPSFVAFGGIHKFMKIPKGDEYFGPADYANKLIDVLYNYADEHRIWIE